MSAKPVVEGMADFQYPVPLFVHNTFIDTQCNRPASLEGFFQERQIFSCPGSRISEPGSEFEGAALQGALRRTPYCPGEVLTQSAAFGSSAPLVLANEEEQQEKSEEEAAKDDVKNKDLDAVAPGAAAGGAPKTPDHDSRSDCSTTDMAGTAGTASGCPPSPQLSYGEAPLPAFPLRLGEAIPPPANMPPAPSVPMPFAGYFSNPTMAMVVPPEMQTTIAPEVSFSKGSAGHASGDCKPCAFLHTKGCASGADCDFCHLCPKGEKQRRQKEKRAFFGAMGRFQKFFPQSESSSYN
eukprot:TRINITY_DN23105_c0_g1_i1.p1 TRINITY_DN23105_c0_g1~~TRINITY_DN23105_c0_g1_i1.p1  ORF type:complete len:295 (-),score=68.59 TRINITY_DN23105_c0_g1_i1:227-1111(-)